MTDVIRHAVALLACLLAIAGDAYACAVHDAFPYVATGLLGVPLAIGALLGAILSYASLFDALKRMEDEP